MWSVAYLLAGLLVIISPATVYSQETDTHDHVILHDGTEIYGEIQEISYWESGNIDTLIIIDERTGEKLNFIGRQIKKVENDVPLIEPDFQRLDSSMKKTTDVVYLKNGSILRGEITEININENIKLKRDDGSINVVDYQDIEKIAQTESNRNDNIDPSINDYYTYGMRVADSEFTTKSQGAGALAGFSLGLIGWGIGYAIISGQEITVPPIYTNDFEDNETFQFQEGYKSRAKAIQKSKFNSGAAIGTLVIISLFLLSAD